MEQHRKRAYRRLPYMAMLEIRPIQWLVFRWYYLLRPSFWRRDVRAIRQAGALADWLHNLADFSARDFDGFNEKMFWEDCERRMADHPGQGWYRRSFEKYLAEGECELFRSGP